MASCTTRASQPPPPQDTTLVGRRLRRRFCPHCSELLAKTTYYRHRRIFYDCHRRQWRTSAQAEADKQLPNATCITNSGEGHDDSRSASPIDDGILIMVWQQLKAMVLAIINVIACRSAFIPWTSMEESLITCTLTNRFWNTARDH